MLTRYETWVENFELFLFVLGWLVTKFTLFTKYEKDECEEILKEVRPKNSRELPRKDQKTVVLLQETINLKKESGVSTKIIFTTEIQTDKHGYGHNGLNVSER